LTIPLGIVSEIRTAQAWQTRWSKRPWSQLLDGFLAVTGFGGGVWMITHPTGWLPTEDLAGTPLDDWMLPGVALVLVNGVWPAVALAASARRWRWAPLLQVGVGVSLLAWLAVQIPLVGYAVPFQPIYSAVAVALIALNLRAARDLLRP
jgi:hypothetical protein